jgi:SAM-dependent methyltransferase
MIGRLGICSHSVCGEGLRAVNEHPPASLEAALRIEELRAGFLRYTRQAFARLPALARPRILDVGCGAGAATLELARLSDGAVVGIDTDAAALAAAGRRIEAAGIGQRVELANVSLFDCDFAAGSFDVLWEEGVLHLLDHARSLPVCHRLLRPGGFLVMHETVAWFAMVEDRLRGVGFAPFAQLLLPRCCWWTDYYAPLEARIGALRAAHGDDLAPGALVQYEREIAMVKADPARFDCGFFVGEKGRAAPAT